MSVVAWDGKTMASDRRCLVGSVIKTTTKLFRVYGALVGVTGDLSRGMAMVEWFRNGAAEADFPTARGEHHANLLVVGPDRRARRYENSPVCFYYEDAFAAAGSGEEGALVAMACGKTATEAVELVSRFNNGCGNGVDTLELETSIKAGMR